MPYNLVASCNVIESNAVLIYCVILPDLAQSWCIRYKMLYDDFQVAANVRFWHTCDSGKGGNLHSTVQISFCFGCDSQLVSGREKDLVDFFICYCAVLPQQFSVTQVSNSPKWQCIWLAIYPTPLTWKLPALCRCPITSASSRFGFSSNGCTTNVKALRNGFSTQDRMIMPLSPVHRMALDWSLPNNSPRKVTIWCCLVERRRSWREWQGKFKHNICNAKM